MTLKHADYNDLEKIMQLYKSVIGTEFCAWNEYYPEYEELNHDFETENLYTLNENNTIIGAVSVVPENEMDNLDIWKINDKTVHEIARIVVDKKYQGKGNAYQMVSLIIEHLKENGCKSVHLSVADINIPAWKTYKKLGFEIVGEQDMYGGHYFLCEKIL